MPLPSSGTNGINYSASFVISSNCLDTCPKCGLNICEHTSVAEVINLPNSISQDFSTYSSDSSLIKQIFNDSTSTTSASSSTVPNNNVSMEEINVCSNKSIEPHLEQYLMLLKKYNYDNSENNKSNSHKVKFTSSLNLRPLSCQMNAIDNDTTDKIIREFFDSSKPPSNSNKAKYSTIGTETAAPVLKENKTIVTENTENDPTPWHSSPKTEIAKQTVENFQQEKTKKKKMKFSNFRLFLKSNKEDCKQTSSKTILRSNGLVNCLTSSASSSSSSCEEMGTGKIN